MKRSNLAIAVDRQPPIVSCEWCGTRMVAGARIKCCTERRRRERKPKARRPGLDIDQTEQE